MNAWFQYRTAGLYCVPGEFYVDPQVPVARAVVSHAHSDHYPRFCHEVYATTETLAMGRHRYMSGAAKVAHERKCGEPFEIGPVKVTLLHAGHILGSAQVLLEFQGERLLYTGDIGFDANPTCAPIVYPDVPIDYMVCESTFGEKEEHPSPEDALAQCMAEAGKRPVLIGTYVLGKAQRINRLIQDLRPDLPVFVDRTIVPLHRIYREFGIDPGRHHLYRRQDVKRFHGQYIWLLPPRKLTGFAGDRLYHKVFASGWDNTNRAAWLNGRLEVSDHASQTELEGYIAKVRPKMVGFWHGYPKRLIEVCQGMGMEAKELKVFDGQLKLF